MHRSSIVSASRGSRKQIRRTVSRVTIDALERRRLLAAVTWDGGGDGVNWHRSQQLVHQRAARLATRQRDRLIDDLT